MQLDAMADPPAPQSFSPVTVMLISTNDLLWTGVHISVQTVSDVLIVDDVTELGRAAERARELKPDVVVTGLYLRNTSTLPILHEIREASPEARLVVLADEFRPDELLALASLGVAGYLLWHGMDLASLRYCLNILAGGDFVVSSRSVSQQLTELSSARRSLDGAPVVLSEREQMVLDRLAAGLTQEQIARALQVGLRTIKRITAGLGAKLEAPSPFVLGVRAQELGLLPSRETAGNSAASR